MLETSARIPLICPTVVAFITNNPRQLAGQIAFSSSNLDRDLLSGFFRARFSLSYRGRVCQARSVTISSELRRPGAGRLSMEAPWAVAQRCTVGIFPI